MQTLLERLVDFAPGLDAAFEANPEEVCYPISQVEGTIPAWLRGTYYLNGPAGFHFEDGFCYRNWLDGDGMVAALRIGDEEIRFTSRYVRSRKFVKERDGDAANPVYRAFGTAFEGDRLKRGIGTESPYNVSVFPYRGKLLAFGEQSLPIELDPVTLETLTPGRAFDFDRAVNEAAPFSAHPKIDSESGELLNFGIFFAPQNPLLIYYRFDSEGKLACRSRTPIDLPCSLHDFAASRNYVIFYLSPYILNAGGLTERGLATIDALSWEPERGSQLLVLSRDNGAEVARIDVEGRYCLHTINAFESDGQLVVDLIEFERPVYDQYQVVPELFTDVPQGQPARFTLDLVNQQVVSRSTIDYCSAPDFPAIDSRRDTLESDDMWVLGISSAGRTGRKFFDRLVHLRWSQPNDADEWIAPDGHYLGGEPALIAGPDGHDVVVCPIFDSGAGVTHFGFFDSSNIAAGPTATVRLQGRMHLAFHSSFFPA